MTQSIVINGLEITTDSFKDYRYNKGIDLLQTKGYERYPDLSEIIDLLDEPTISNGLGKRNYEWLNMVWEKSGDILIAYKDPRGLVWQESGSYHTSEFTYSSRQEFDIGHLLPKNGVRQIEWRKTLRALSDDFIHFHLGRSFESLPEYLKKEGVIAVNLPYTDHLFPISFINIKFTDEPQLFIIGGLGCLGDVRGVREISKK